MRLDQALVVRKLCESRQEAQELISAGCVIVDNLITTKQTKKIDNTATIEVTKRRKFVSRGGDKLEGVLMAIYGTSEGIFEAMRGISALDVGSSTGGFTDCLLQYGVASVHAVDVGTSQLHTRLRTNPQIHVFENTDIRTFTTNQLFSVIVGDISFIALDKIFDTILNFGNNGTHYFLLIKPQFEVGKGNTKKGIVRDEALVATIIQKYKQLALDRGLHDVSITPCVISGGDGNQEYFLYGIAS